MFKKILIANRGEIACRVAASARRMGIQTVAIYSDVDALAKHVSACSQAVRIAGQTPAGSYLNGRAIIEAALATGAQAIHPGYGFLSENEAFAQACTDAGLVFVGPPASAIRAMGLKSESKQRMQEAGVPLVPGYHGAQQDLPWLQSQADLIGYPVLIKASAGGGGKGMRLVAQPEDFAEALASCKREAMKSFGNDTVLIERYVNCPRHIEIQVFADGHGQCVHLLERDWSVQRRHQKVLEEAPAPGLSAALREQMGQAALAAARAVGYVGAGTVEFIVEQAGGYDAADQMRFYFMEMNTRLQVEHPVTEAITGVDLVEWQLRVAAGEGLPLQQHQITSQGHAIEARICAESPDKQFLPATGRLQVYRKPAHTAFSPSSIRFDDGVTEGDEIGADYDSMVAKLIVHGRDRQHALGLLDQALAQTRIVGVANNIQFLRHVVQSPSFTNARLDTALIAREADRLFDQQTIESAWVAAFAVAHALAQEQTLQGQDPFSKRDGWQSHGLTTRHFQIKIGQDMLGAALLYGRSGAHQLQVGEHAGAFSYAPDGDGLDVVWRESSRYAHVYSDGALVQIFAADGAARAEVVDPLGIVGATGPEAGRLSAPMPGKILAFAVQSGDKVSQGQVLAVLEAMKMEHNITAPCDGVVSELLFQPGELVMEGAELLKLQPVGDAHAGA